MAFVVANELETFIGLIESTFNAKVDRGETITFDEEARDFGTFTNRYIGLMIPFTVDGEEYKFFNDSDRTGFGEFHWPWENAEELFAYFEADFLVMSEM